MPIDVETSVRIPTIDDVDREQHLSCLDRCLDALSGNDRELILEYYGGGTERNAERRRRLAAGLGLTPNALMIRACRIRDRLEACVRSCVAAR